jgi:pimeloyl-ACP methyl ester carboxylesterase
MGGGMATIYASLFPENVKSLILLAPAGLMGYFPLKFSIDCCCCFHPVARSYLKNPDNQESSWRHAYYEPQGTALMNLESMISVLHIMYKKNPYAHEAFWNSAVQFPLTDLREEIECVGNQNNIKFFFLWGKNDPLIPISNLSLWISIIQEQTKVRGNEFHVKTKIFDRCSHSIMGEHRPEVLKNIASFVEELSIEIDSI